MRKIAPNDDVLSKCLRQQKSIKEKEEEARPSWRDKLRTTPEVNDKERVKNF